MTTNANQKKRYTAGWIDLYIIVAIGFACLVIGLACLAVREYRYRENTMYPEAFAAWEKHTGNEKGLTYKEWRSLIQATEKPDQTNIILIPR